MLKISERGFLETCHRFAELFGFYPLYPDTRWYQPGTLWVIFLALISAIIFLVLIIILIVFYPIAKIYDFLTE